MTADITAEHIRLTHAEQVTTLTIDRPAKKNAITQAMYAAMAEALNAYAEDDAARAFVITGAEGMFTAGNDLADFSTDDGEEHDLPPVARFLGAIHNCPKPVIAAVNGPAIGVGLTLLLHADLIYAAESATFSAPFVKLGLVPEAASSMLLPAAVGMAVANDILLAGRVLGAQEAQEVGLVSRIFPDAALQTAVADIARGVAASSPTALRRSKALIRHERERVATHMTAEGRVFVDQLKSPDFAESVAAMIEKRAPVYR